MDVRKKLVELLYIIIQPGQKTLGDIADYLIAHGVTVQECKLGDKKTNADRIRAMSDEELAKMLYKTGRNYRAICADPVVDFRECYGDLLQWLQEPAKEG